jgi:transmembrane sensor
MTDESRIVPFPQGTSGKAQAADWLARLDRGSLSDAEHAAFEAWLAENSRNRFEIQRLARFWYGLDRPLSNAFARQPRKQRDYEPGTRARAPGWRIVAGLALITVALLGIFLLEPVTPTDESARFATEIGHSRHVQLNDGSSFILNTNSIVQQDYSASQRTVRLVSGEAVFDVAHDASRPFVVLAAGGVFRAVGTRFSVRMDTDHVTVTVTEGRVALQQRLSDWYDWVDQDIPGAANGDAEGLSELILVRAGELGQVHRTEGASKKAVTPHTVIEALSWIEGELVFYDREFQAVIEEVARYTPVTIRIEDESLKKRRITGIIQIGEMDMMLESIERTLDVTVERVSPTLVRVRS